MKILIDIIGWSGSGLIILAYALTLIGNKKYLDYGKYLNFVGGILIATNCYYYSAIPPFTTNLIWSIIATLAIYRSSKVKKTTKKNCNKNNCLT
ncbi:hypothetical protein JCM19314_657 [Nonlabens ulvanivorans]|uniref:CBU-0592-like domain-containing protein n=1 Tax=Nonlabens ulvanivorans TaxID=906888 RepID=A0A090QG30_NONUL|nr:hypothetical protein [Nonlabens ulvanivorans]GAL01213.1 hypothetical protein JCM19314_657 [Nonlabens ulvanivorans]